MLRIGEIERITEVPSKTLRYWEDFGLIKPAYVDKFTGYRGYDQKNIELISQICYLKKLGFSLKEIKNLSDEVIAEKSKELKQKIAEISKSIKSISSFTKNEKGDIVMKKFVNDPQAIGKWSLVGLASTLEDANSDKYYQDEDYIVKDLYLMEKGKEYWVIGWTKGIIYIGGRENPYTIVGDKMIVSIKIFNKKAEFYAIYKRVDSANHSVEEFKVHDDIDIPFKSNKKMIGFWEAVSIVDKPQQFNPNKKSEWKLFLKSIAISPDGTAIFTLQNGHTFTNNWTDKFIINPYEKTASNCSIKLLDGQTYLIMEWKSGDYVFGGVISCYYVFKKLD